MRSTDGHRNPRKRTLWIGFFRFFMRFEARIQGSSRFSSFSKPGRVSLEPLVDWKLPIQSLIDAHGFLITVTSIMLLSELYSMIKRRALTFLSIFAVGLILTILTLFFAPRSYRSEARILLRLGRESVALDPTITETGKPLPFIERGKEK